ncbi:MAG: peptidylprolyl isomerase [Fibrobacterota bacterium]
MRFFLPILAVCAFLFAVPLDRIVAVIDDNIILESELNELTFFSYQNSGKAVPVGSPEFNAARLEVLRSMIDDKLLLKEAEAESIAVSMEEVVRQREAQIDGYVQKLGSRDALEAELKKSYGMTLSKLKKNLDDQIREQMLKMRLAEALRQKRPPTRDEIEQFYTQYRDSLPTEKSSLRVSHIERRIQPSPEVEAAAKARIEAIEKEILSGKPFDALARDVSDDPASAKNGGDLGFFGKGLLDPAFEKAAFALNPGETSRIIRSVFGYHIIRLEERRDKDIRARHILVLVRPGRDDTLRTARLLDSLGKACVTDTAFAGAAARGSDDKLTRDKGGDLGWVGEANLNGDYKKAISEIAVGHNSAPVLIGDALHVFRVIERRAERTLTLESDYDAIKSMAVNQRLKKELSGLADRMRKRCYVENRLETPGH